MVLLGFWLAVIGYGLAYAGVAKINGVPGNQASLRKAFSLAGIPPGPGTQAASVQGSTLADTRAAAAAQQEVTIPGRVIAR